MTDDDALVLLASDHAEPGRFTVRALGDGVAAGTGPGSGPWKNRKTHPNEDSAVVLRRGDAVVAAVADAHHGKGSGERMARAFADAASARWPADTDALFELLVHAAEASTQARVLGDYSESTFVAALVAGSTLHWASVGDSLLVLLRGGSPARRVATETSHFAGGATSLHAARQYLRDAMIVDAGALPLQHNDLVLLASDGLESDVSGLDIDAAGALLLGEDALLTGVQKLFEIATLPPGGRDNLTVVAVVNRVRT
ncbi:MAG: protein phosphatase 2C domain-containing protein [Deltaproteobacteria bacterium]|nr:protein phosphatase 2C domain-containing protein [Deltaproteobacteria bacterium]